MSLGGALHTLARLRHLHYGQAILTTLFTIGLAVPVGCASTGQLPANQDSEQAEARGQQDEDTAALRQKIIICSSSLVPLCQDAAANYQKSLRLGTVIAYCTNDVSAERRVQDRQMLLLEMSTLISHLCLLDTPEAMIPVRNLLGDAFAEHQQMIGTIQVVQGHRDHYGPCMCYLSTRIEELRQVCLSHEEEALATYEQACQAWALVLAQYAIAPSDIGLAGSVAWPL